MKKLLSLPPNLVECFHDIMHADHKVHIPEHTRSLSGNL